MPNNSHTYPHTKLHPQKPSKNSQTLHFAFNFKAINNPPRHIPSITIKKGSKLRNAYPSFISLSAAPGMITIK